MLSIQEYNILEIDGRVKLSNRFIRAFRPKLFENGGFPTTVKKEEELVRYIDSMHAYSFESHYHNLCGGITREEFSKQLCYRFQKPIVSTSANISGEPTAQNYCDINQEIIDAVDYVCWTRRQEHKPHKPSSIIRLREDGQVEIIRK